MAEIGFFIHEKMDLHICDSVKVIWSKFIDPVTFYGKKNCRGSPFRVQNLALLLPINWARVTEFQKFFFSWITFFKTVLLMYIKPYSERFFFYLRGGGSGVLVIGVKNIFSWKKSFPPIFYIPCNKNSSWEYRISKKCLKCYCLLHQGIGTKVCWV